MKSWNNDFFLDQAMQRRIHRAKQIQASQDMEADEDDDEEESLLEKGHRRRGKTKTPKRER